MRQYIPFEIHPWGDLNQFEAPGLVAAKHRSFGYKQGSLTILMCERARIGHLLHRTDELLFTTFARDLCLPTRPAYVEAAAGECRAEDHRLRVLTDIDEAARADNSVAESTDIDVAVLVDLCERKKRQLETTTVIKVELIRLINHSLIIARCPRLITRRRSAPD